MKLTGHFFLNLQYQRFENSLNKATPPQAIASDIPWDSLPPEFQSDIDDVINISSSKDSTALLCFFKGSKYLKYDIKKAQPVGQPAEISEGWPGLKGTGFDKGIDAASEWAVWEGSASTPDASTIMFFKGDQFISCTPEGNKIEQKPISELCKDFKSGTNKKYSADLDCVLLWCNETAYFFQEGEYIRYNLKTGRIDKTEIAISTYWHNVSFSKIQAAVLFDETLLASQPADTGPHIITNAGPAHKEDECHCGGEQHTHHHHYHGGTHQHCHGGTHHHHHNHHHHRGQGSGNTMPYPVPILPKGQFTVTLVNNDIQSRTAILNIDGKDNSLNVEGNKAISWAYTTATGEVTIALYGGSGDNSTSLALEIQGSTAHSITLGTEKTTGKAHHVGMDVLVHIDWTTQVNN